MAQVENMEVKLSGDSSNYQKMLTSAVSKTKGAVSQMISQFGSLAVAIGAPLGAIAGSSVKAFASFDHAMAKSLSIMKASDEQIQRMKDTAKGISVTGNTDVVELAKSFYYLASAGLDTEKAIGALATVETLATASEMGMEEATTLLMDSQAALGMKVDDTAQNLKNLARVSDTMSRAGDVANASIKEFAEALTNRAGASLRNYNKTVEEGLAVLAAYADQGTKGALAGSNLSRVMSLLAGSSRECAKEQRALMQTIGETSLVFDPATGEMRNFADLIELLERSMAGMSSEMKAYTLDQIGFDKRVQDAIMPLLGTSKAIRNYEKELKNAGGSTQRVADNIMKSFSNQMAVVRNNVKVASIEIGESLAPALGMLGSVMKDVIGWFRALTPQTKEMVIAIGLVVGAFAAFKLAVIATGIAFNLFFGGIGLWGGIITTAFAGAAVGVASLTVSMGGISKAFGYIKDQALAAWAWMKPIRQALASFFGALWETVVNTFTRVKDFAAKTWDSISGGSGVDWKRVKDNIVDTLLFAEFALRDFDQVAQFTWTSIRLGWVHLTDTFSFFFRTTIPELASWFGRNWQQVFTDAFNIVTDLMETQVRNMVTIASNIPGLISGKISFGELSQMMRMPLDEFQSSIEEMPELTKKTMSDQEAELRKLWAEQGSKMMGDFNDFKNQKLAEWNKQTPPPTAPSPDTQKKGEDKAKEHGKLLGQNLTDGVKGELDKLESVAFRSAEAFARIREYTERIHGVRGDKPNQPGATGGGMSSGATASGSATMSAAVSNAGVDRKGSQVQETQLTVLKDIRQINKVQLEYIKKSALVPADL